MEVGVRHGDFTVLVATLLLVSNLVFDLQGTSTRFDHLLGHQVSRFSITETGVDISNDWYDVSDVVVNLILNRRFSSSITRFTSSVQLAEQTTQLTCVGLTQEGVKLFNQASNCSLLVHRLIGKRTEVRTQGRNHPARQVQVLAVGFATEMLLDSNQLLLADKTVPATQRLGVLGLIGIECFHVSTHDVGSVLSDFQTRFEFVLSPHASCRLRVDRIPRAACGMSNGCN